jgi:Raf kinase inhibitor-like YbhB/YbcL family protein
MRLNSESFKEGNEIPMHHTCEGKDTSPELSWADLPKGTQSLALVVDDPDAPDPAAPKMTWVHWVLFNVPTSVSGLPAAVKKDELPPGAKSGVNDWRREGYGGPCPPKGRHRYFHKLYALDTKLELDRPTKAELEKAMKGHVLAEATLIGTYQKKF